MTTTQKILVMKFGGTSVGSSEAMTRVVNIVKTTCSEWPGVVVVSSALSGITDMLLNSAASAAANDLEPMSRTAKEIYRRHEEIADQVIPDSQARIQVKDEITKLVSEFTNLCQAISILGEASPRALDATASLGERMSVRLLAAALASNQVSAQFVESSKIILTDENYQGAHPIQDETFARCQQVLLPLIEQGIVPVVTGFLGGTRSGVTTTLGRGGSDFSASLLGAAISASEVWIWTDVDGVMSADPRLVPDAHTIKELSYREISELAYFGAKVLHPKTIRPVIEAGIGLRVCNTFQPELPGTHLIADQNDVHPGVIKAVTAIMDVKLITIEGRGMLGVPGVAARTFGAVAATHTSVPLITQASSEQSICFAVPSVACQKVLAELEKVFSPEITRRDIDRIWATDEMVIVTVVGAGMRNIPGIAGRVFSALGNQNVNVIAIAQGSSEVSISLVADAKDARKAVTSLHELIEKV
jgi:bifunctional aspartokinase / homoserine dehydrogenase 1